VHLKRRLLMITAAGGVAAAALGVAAPTHVLAGSGWSQVCEDNADDIPIMTSPITLGVQFASPGLGAIGHQGYGPNSYVTLCYSDTPYGYTGPETTGGMFEVGLTNGQYPYVWCPNDANAQQLTINCGLFPTASFTPSGVAGGTLTTTVPFSVCIGSPLTNPAGSSCTASTSLEPTIGATGLVVDSVGLGGCCQASETGLGVVPAGTLYIDGVIQQQFESEAGAGVTPSAASGDVVTAGIPVCIGPCETIPVPSGAWVGTDGAPVGTLDIPGLAPINIPTPVPPGIGSCESVGTTCPSPY